FRSVAVRAIRSGRVWPRAGCRNEPIAAPGAALVPIRSYDADRARVGMCGLRVRGARTLPFLCRSRPEMDRSRRALPGLARTAQLRILNRGTGGTKAILQAFMLHCVNHRFGLTLAGGGIATIGAAPVGPINPPRARA